MYSIILVFASIGSIPLSHTFFIKTSILSKYLVDEKSLKILDHALAPHPASCFLCSLAWASLAGKPAAALAAREKLISCPGFAVEEGLKAQKQTQTIGTHGLINCI